MNVDVEAVRMWTRLVVNTDPYNSINNVLKLTLASIKSRGTGDLEGSAMASLSLFTQFFHFPNEIHKAKMLHIDKDLLPTILNTDNKVFARRMSLPCMFLNQDFRFGEYLIKGVLMIDMRAEYENMSPKDKFEVDRDYPSFNWDNINVLCMFVKDSDVTMGTTCEEWLMFHLEGDTVNSPMSKFVSKIVVNVLDFMNNDFETIEINTIVSTRDEQKKAVARGKLPIPTKVYIRPKPNFRNYYIQLNDDIRNLPYSHKFLVKGFIRHLRSPRYGDKMGSVIQVRPFVKGQGIFIEKKYELEEVKQ